MALSTIPLSLIALGGHIILKSVDGELGKLQPLCDILKNVDTGLVIDDFKSISNRKEINLNGHLHKVYIKAINESVNDIKKAFKKKEGIKLTLREHLSTFSTNNRKIYATLEYTCEKIVREFLNPTNIEIAFDDHIQILDNHNYFEKLIDVMIANGKAVEEHGRSKEYEPYLYFSDITGETLGKFTEILKLNLPKFFSDSFKKALHENERAYNAYSIYMQHAIFTRQSKNEQKILDKLDFINKPPLKGLSPKKVRNQMEHFSFRAQNSQYVGREDARLHLQNFMSDNDKFRWLIINGEGGSGKSRLAYELCAEAFMANWEVGFYDYDSDKDYTFNKFYANKNTLIIFDYIGADDKFLTVCNAIKKINQDVNDLEYQIEIQDIPDKKAKELLLPKIRFVLVERFLLDHQLKAIQNEELRLNFYPHEDITTNDETTFGNDTIANKKILPEPYKLRELNDDEKWELIRQIAGDKAIEGQKDQIMNQIVNIDPLKRPLFIFMAATALKENDSITNWDKETMLSWYLERMEHKIWKHHPWYSKKRKSLKNLIWITSVANSLSQNEIENILHIKTEKGKSCFNFKRNETFGDHLSSLFSKVGDTTHYDKLEGLQPDIIAEHYIISHLNSKDGQVYSEKIQEIAWKYFPIRTLEMFAKVARDFIDDQNFQKIIQFLFTQEFEGLGKFFYIISNQLISDTKYKKAIEYCFKAIDLLEKKESNDESKMYLTWSYYIRACCYKYLFKFDNAIEDYKTSITLDPKYANAYYHLFEIYQETDQFKEALSCFNKALEFDPESANDTVNTGVRRFLASKIEKGWYNFTLAWIKKYQNRKEEINALLPIMTYVNGNKVITNLYEELSSNAPQQLTTSSLSFYPNLLYHKYTSKNILDYETEIRFITDESHKIIMLFNGYSNPILTLNKYATINLDDDNINDYLTFFCEHVHADLGAFQIINLIEDIIWLEEFETEDSQQSIFNQVKAHYQSIEQSIKKEDDSWLINRLIHYGGHLFEATFKIYNNGTIEMLRDKPLDTNLPTYSLSTLGAFYIMESSKLINIKTNQVKLDANNTLGIWITINRTWLSESKKTIQKNDDTSDELKNQMAFIEKELSEPKGAKTVELILHKLKQDDYMSKTSLSFYPKHHIYEIDLTSEYESINDYFIRLIVDDDNKIQMFLNGQSQWIHTLNANVPVKLNAQNFSQYLSFFSNNVHGDLGGFQIIESVKDVIWNDVVEQDGIDKYSKIIEDSLQKVNDEIIEKENHIWQIEKLVLYSNTLFLATFQVAKKDGSVNMIEDTPVKDGFPIKYLKRVGCFYYYIE